jgi:hypothetical protein
MNKSKQVLKSYLIVFSLLLSIAIGGYKLFSPQQAVACDNCTSWSLFCSNGGDDWGVAYGVWRYWYTSYMTGDPIRFCQHYSQHSYDCPESGTDTCCLGSSGTVFDTETECINNEGGKTYGCCDPTGGPNGNGNGGCTFTTCNTCTLPTCPSGYSTTNRNCSTASCPTGWTRVQRTGDTVHSCRGSCTRYDNCDDDCGTSYTYCYRNLTNANAPLAPDNAILTTPAESRNLSTSVASRTIFNYTAGGAITVSSSSTPADTTIVGYRYRLRLTDDGSDLENTGDGTNITRSLTYSPFPTTGVILAQRYNWRCPDNTVLQRSSSTYGYFCMERNVAPTTAPSNMNITIDDQVYALSTSAADPRVVKYPSTNATTTNTRLQVLPTRTTPSTAGGSGYRVEANNYGVGGVWSAFACNRAEDFCSESGSGSSSETEMLTVVNTFASGGTPSRAVDGNTSTSWNAGSGVPHWITLDLGSSRKANSIRVWAEALPSGTVYYNLLGSNDNSSFVTISSGVSLQSNDGFYTHNFSEVTYRYFRLHCYNWNTSWVAIREIELYGETTTTFTGSNAFDFSPNSTPLLSVLAQGAEGKIDSKYYNMNQCNSTNLYSNAEDFYYRVNNNPTFGCPAIVNDAADNTTSKGCTTTTHTGIEANNPLKFRMSGSDADGVEEIKGAVIWLSRDGLSSQIPSFPAISSTYTRSSRDHIAVMIMQRAGSWSNSPLIYAADSTSANSWGNITSHREIRSSLGVMARVASASATQVGNEIVFNLQIDFTPPTLGQPADTYPEGNYEISGIVFDQHMLLASGTVLDQFYMSTDCRVGGWNFDLREPVFADGFPYDEVIFSNILRLNWEFQGTGSNATNAVINAYKDVPQDDVRLETPGGYPDITLFPPPNESQIGVFTDPNAWNIPNTVSSSTFSSSARINILNNTEGSPIFHVTAYDQACNYVLNTQPVIINLNPWMATKGGFVFSGGSVGADAKKFETYATFINTVLTEARANELDIATEFVSTRSNSINNLIYPTLQAVRAHGIYNSNSQRTDWYEHFSERFDEQQVILGMSNFKQIGFLDGMTSISQECDTEYCYIRESGDLVVPNSFRDCDKKTLVMASGDIYVQPDILNGGDDNIDGCIFVSGGDIYIGAGAWKTGNATGVTETKYDYLEAYMIADNMIDIELVDLMDGANIIYTRDGLEIYGGLVGFGRDVSGGSAIEVNRSFGLWNAYLPTVANTWDPRYAKLSEIFFGPGAAMYKREVGFKPY